MSQPVPDPTAGLPAAVFAAATDALQLTDPERGVAIAALCAAHPEHAAQLQSLCDELRAVERLLDEGYGPRAEPPTRLGQYRVLRKLGAGAFGEVFLCEQTAPVRRSVAVKVLRAGVGDRTTLLRFEAERQLVASMQHPGLVQVFDAGTLADGRPFFVMDAIDGTPIDRYCDAHAASVEVRLELFGELCRAVQHAHDRGIVHRDLKPANVLVVEIDGRPRPKVIDFGIAKLLQGRSEAGAFATETGRVVGTPGYMSPEQQQGASDAADARADVFSLGVMLYDLLCGQLPWSVGTEAASTDPERPSTRVSTSTATATAVARDRSTQPRRLASRLRGDLDWIVLKCLHREREQRYPSVQELLDDLERHRRAEPVHALPPSTGYRLRKLLRRHRTAALAFGSATFVALGTLAALQYHRTTSAALAAAISRAESNFATAAAAVERLVERANDPLVREAPEGDATRDAMLRDALSFYDRFLLERPTDPQLRSKRCRTLLRLLRVQTLLGDAKSALAAAQETIQEAEALWAMQPTDDAARGLLGEALCEQGTARSQLDDQAGAQASFASAVEHLAASAAALPAQFGCAHALALRNAALQAPSRSPAREQGLRNSLQALERLRSIAPGAELEAEYVLSACELGELLTLDSRLTESDAVLQQASARLPLVGQDRLHLTYRVSTLRADVAFQGGERRSTLEHYEAALAAVVAWEQAQPKRLLPRTLRAQAHRALGFAQNYAGDWDRSVASYRQAITLGDELAERFPAVATRTLDQALLLEEFALTLLDRFDQSVLAEAAACAERGATLELRASGGGRSARRWRFLCLQATIAEARTAGGGDAFWSGVESALAGDPEPVARQQDQLVGAYASLSRWHLDHDRTEAATQWLAKADAMIAAAPKEHSKRAVDTGWLAARLAAARADHAGCAAAAERILAARSTWYGRRRAADCLHLAWRCASRDPAAAAAASDYRQRALDWYGRVRQSLEKDVAAAERDPWYVLPWAIACIRAAELSCATGDVAAARPLLVAALPRLEAIRDATPADLWDEQVLQEGRALQAQLATIGR